jgi:hypothetical protein
MVELKFVLNSGEDCIVETYAGLNPMIAERGSGMPREPKLAKL